MAVARLMPNVGGPSYSKRKILMIVVMSRLLDAAPVWVVKTLRAKCNISSLIRAQRLAALRLTKAFRTVSDDAALVLAGTTSVDLTTLKREPASTR